MWRSSSTRPEALFEIDRDHGWPLSLDGRLGWQRFGGSLGMQLFQDQPLARHALEKEPLQGGIQDSDPRQRVPEELFASDAHKEQLEVAHTAEVGRADHRPDGVEPRDTGRGGLFPDGWHDPE